MDDLNSRLHSASTITATQILSKLVENVDLKSESVNVSERPEFKFLKEKCFSNNDSINISAGHAILTILRNFNKQSIVKSVLSDFGSVITTAKFPKNIAFVLNHLLILDLELELVNNKKFKNGFNLRVPQHPFIVMLNEDSTSWSTIIQEIMYSYNTCVGGETTLNELYKPVYLYVLCNPKPGDSTLFKHRLWTFIVENGTADLIQLLLSWMLFEGKTNTELARDFLLKLATINEEKKYINENLMFLLEVSMLHQLLLDNLDPRSVILNLSGKNDLDLNDVSNPALLILSKSILICPSVYLVQLLQLCKNILLQCNATSGIIKQVILTSLLHWIANPTLLTSTAISIANDIVRHISNSRGKRTSGIVLEDLFNVDYKLILTNNEVYTAIKLTIMASNWKDNNDVKIWIEKLKKAPILFLIKIVHFLGGIFLCEFGDSTINIQIYELILKCLKCDKTLAALILTLNLYKLSNTNDSMLHYALLQSLPQMGVIRDNIQKIVSTIKILHQGRDALKTYSMSLMFDLWNIENKCYSHLETFLIGEYDGSCLKWEYSITKANILKQLCAEKPELYGKDMVAHLSKILNECSSDDDALAAALAIDGITLLCKSEIIDAVTTWATLAPMFKADKRVSVIKSVCLLISEMPTLSYTEAYPKLIEEIIDKLWEYIIINHDNEVWQSALTALSSFSVDQIVAQMPEEFLDEETLAIKKGGKPIPGNCWILFLKNCDQSKLKIAGDFLIKMVSLEISGYLKFVYQVKGTREPIDYSFLPSNSIVRAVLAYIKSKIAKWKFDLQKEVYLECLRIISQTYTKPLPPLDWCFLQELYHEPAAKDYCISIAAHQVILSGTARRFVVNYIEAVTENYTQDDLRNIYNNLTHLANSVQPFTLKPFFEATISNAVILFENGDESLLITILGYLNRTLEDGSVQEANKFVIAEIISDLVSDSDCSSKLFNTLLNTIAVFPPKAINDLSCHKSVKEVLKDWFKKAVRIRCHLAVHSKEKKLSWLNDLMEIGGLYDDLHSFIFEEIGKVFFKHIDDMECTLWILEIIIQIQAMTAEKIIKNQMLFCCNIFILATVVFSGHFIFMDGYSNCEEMYKLFPSAIASLLEVNHWSICTNQTLEWFHFMHVEKILQNHFGDLFVDCLKALRHEDEFQKNMRWTKYLNVEC